ncbi:hypothetical protein [Herbidospora sp. RD11066]
MIRCLRLLTVAMLLTGCGEPEAQPRELYRSAGTAPAAPSATPVDGHVVTFEAESRDGASKLGTVIYSAAGTSASAFIHQRQDRVELPFSTTVAINGPVPELTLSVLNDGAEAVMICRIRVDGQLVLEESGSGMMGALCSLPPTT